MKKHFFLSRMKIAFNIFALRFQLDAQRLYADFQYQAWLLISKIDVNSVRDPIIRRRLRYLSVVGPSALPPDQLDRVNASFVSTRKL